MFLFRLLQGSKLGKRRRAGGDESTSLHIHELFDLTHLLQVTLKMNYNVESIPDKIRLKVLWRTHIFIPWDTLSKKIFKKTVSSFVL